MKTFERSVRASAVVATWLVAAAAAAQPKGVPIRVTVDPGTAVVSVEIAKEGALRGTKLDPVAGQSQVFGGSLPDPFATAQAGVLAIPFLLTARWSAPPAEELYLELKRGAEQEMVFDVMSVKSEGTRHEIEQIERLGKVSYADQIRRYFFARAHHRSMRDVQRLPYHKNAIRSAREWFDASYWLASRDLSVFRMDESAVAVITEYLEKAKTDPDFRKTFNSVITRPGYFEGMLRELRTTKFQLVARVEEAAKQGDLETARTLNAALQQELEKLPKAQRDEVREYRGVTVQQLRNNAGYLETRSKAQ